jgi:hypothetical protein
MSDETDNIRAQAHAKTPRFERIQDGRYRLRAEKERIIFDVDQVRREANSLWCELTVKTDLSEARFLRGNTIHAAALNLSAPRSLKERAKRLEEKARVKDTVIDFESLLEELAVDVITAEREGSPGMILADEPVPPLEQTWVVDGLPLLQENPMILFGDGAAGKSYLALYVACKLEQMGIPTGYFDWECEAKAQRRRLDKVFGRNAPRIFYRRMEAPLIHVAPQIRMDVQARGLKYVICDSISIAIHDALELSSTVASYFQAARSLNVGSLHLAHTTKAEGGDKKPFGSNMWHNLARATWNLKRSEESYGRELKVSAYNRKWNDEARLPALGWQIFFDPNGVTFNRCPAELDRKPEAGATSSSETKDRIAAALRKNGPLTIVDLEERTGLKLETIRKVIQRDDGKLFGKDASYPDRVFRIRLVSSRDDGE